MVTGLTYDLLFTIKSSLLVLTWGPLYYSGFCLTDLPVHPAYLLIMLLTPHFFSGLGPSPDNSTRIKRLFTKSCGMYLCVCKVSLRDRSYNRLRYRAFHGEAVPGDEKLYAKIPQLFVMNQ